MDDNKLTSAERERVEQFATALALALQRIAQEQHTVQPNNQNHSKTSLHGDKK